MVQYKKYHRILSSKFYFYGVLAQLVERLNHNQEAVSSTLTYATILLISNILDS